MRRLSTAVCAIALLLAPGLALGAPPTADDREIARALADKGAELFDAGKYQESIDFFRKADERVHAPTFTLAIAQANAKLGRLIEARDHYQKVIDDKLPPSPPQSFVEAQSTARLELDELTRRIPTLTLVVTGATPGSVKVTIDGAPVAAFDQPIAQNPGDHEVVVTPATGAAITRSVSLREGATERVEIALGPSPSSDKGSGDSKGSIVPAMIGFGVGAVGLGIGAITGAIALGQVGDVKAQCQNNVCPEGLKGDAESAGTLADVSTATFIIGGVGVAAGVVLILLRPGGGSPKPPEQSLHRPRSAPRQAYRSPVFESVQASFGLGSVRVSGRF
jgi:hypothetical protein